MRKVFSDELAQELGYQKYWPERKDWVIATFGVLVACSVLVGILCSILMLTGNWERQFVAKTCADYANYPISQLPAKCAAEYKVSALTNI